MGPGRRQALKEAPASCSLKLGLQNAAQHAGRKAAVPRLLRTLRRKALLPLGLQGLTEGLQHQDHVVLRARRAHQSDAPDLSFELAEAAADLYANPVEKRPADPDLIDA